MSKPDSTTEERIVDQIDDADFTGTEEQLDYLVGWFSRQAARRELAKKNAA